MMRLNETLLALIICVQTSKKYHSAGVLLDLPENDDWCQPTRDDFFAVPSSIFAKAGISACNENFERMLSFEVTDEMLDTPSNDLGKFTVSFYERKENQEE